VVYRLDSWTPYILCTLRVVNQPWRLRSSSKAWSNSPTKTNSINTKFGSVNVAEGIKSAENIFVSPEVTCWNKAPCSRMLLVCSSSCCAACSINEHGRASHQVYPGQTKPLYTCSEAQSSPRVPSCMFPKFRLHS
jgi:hypothetical protein